MTPLDDFLPSVNQFAPGVAEPAALFAIRQACIEFCERTRLWRYEDDFDVTDDEDLLSPPDSQIHEIEALRFNNQKVTPAATQWLDRIWPTWRTDTDGAATPKYFTQTAPNTLRLVPRAAGHVNIYLFLKPSQDAEEVPDFISEQYREVIAQGALSRILMIPNQSFTDGNLAIGYGTAFQSKLDSLSSKGTEGQQRARQRTRATFF